ncbi:MAG: ATP-binding protein [Devosiaceae bacterium]
MADWQETDSKAVPAGKARSVFTRLLARLRRVFSRTIGKDGSSATNGQHTANSAASTVIAPLGAAFAGLRWLISAIGKITKPILPQGLYARSILIIITPIIILQSVVAFVFMERHWELVTERLSQAVTRDIAAVIEMVDTFPADEANQTEIIRIARDALDLNVAFLPDTALPAALPKPFFDLLDRTLSQEISRRIERPFWIDTVGRSNLVEVRVRMDAGQVLRVFARRNQAYASNSHIFLIWMIGTSLVLVVIAVLFLRNQIRPVLRLADAADRFGRGQPVDEQMSLRGAREIRGATVAFWQMRERIERHVDQRTAMLSGVSHDLRTILTRFKLELALLSDEKAAREMGQDVDEMQAMLEGYLAFAKGDDGEASTPNDVQALLEAVVMNTPNANDIELSFEGKSEASVKPIAFKRLITNLVNNALRHADTVKVTAKRTADRLLISIEDNGPGIPQASREDVFRPFFRLDEARNLDDSGTGLGLAIARDIARAHGGEIVLGDSAMGGLRATVTLPA